MLKKYLIKKGKHYCFHFPKFHFGKKKEFDVRFIFNSGCKYDFNSDFNYDINKLWGLSFGLHHRDSFRIGWNSYGTNGEMNSKDGKYIALFYYAYNKGVRTYFQIGAIREGSLGKYKITLDFDNNTIIVSNEFSDDQPIIFPFAFPKFKWGYYLFPYFGGYRRSPDNMKIYLSSK